MSNDKEFPEIKLIPAIRCRVTVEDPDRPGYSYVNLFDTQEYLKDNGLSIKARLQDKIFKYGRTIVSVKAFEGDLYQLEKDGLL